jgi:hypothetical protein
MFNCRESKSGEGYHTFSPPIFTGNTLLAGRYFTTASQENPESRRKQKKDTISPSVQTSPDL